MPKVSITQKFNLVVDGIKLDCLLTAPPNTPTSHIEEKILLVEAFMKNPSQIKMEFEKSVTLTGVKIRADQPKTGDREFSFGLDVTGAPMTDRATIFNLFQTGAAVTVKIIEPETKKKGKAAESAPSPDQPASITEITDIAKDKPADKQQNSAEIREVIIEQALKSALRPITEDADLADRQANPMDDIGIRTALKKAWTPPQSGCINGFSFTALGAHGPKKEPRFWLSEIAEVNANITGKPTLSGPQLINKVRELLAIPVPGKGKPRATVH